MKDILKKLKYYLRYKFISDEKYIKYKFKKRFGYTLDFNNPQTINEKIQWLKLYDRSKIHTLCADKYKVRNYIKGKIGEQYLIPLIFETRNPLDINREKLPDYPCVVKVNHSRGAFLINNMRDTDLKSVQKILTKELNTNFYFRTREWQYKNIVPRVVVEKMLLDPDGNPPIDYKIWCMNGKAIMIQVDTGSKDNHIITFLDPNWNILPFKKNYPIDENVICPNNLKEMITIAEKLSEDFLFVRVDLYNINNSIYFGELTFHPESGFGTFTPCKADYKLGQMLNLKGK